LRGPTRTDQEHAHLADLFASREGDGLDTFGNIGTLRYAILFCRVSGFVGSLMRCSFLSSFGQTDHGKLVAQKTGAAPQGGFNPFAAQQQQQRAQNPEQPFFTI